MIKSSKVTQKESPIEFPLLMRNKETETIAIINGIDGREYRGIAVWTTRNSPVIIGQEVFSSCYAPYHGGVELL